jgi:hypothetical protein
MSSSTCEASLWGPNSSHDVEVVVAVGLPVPLRQTPADRLPKEALVLLNDAFDHGDGEDD